MKRKLMTVPEVAQILRLNEDEVHQLLDRRELAGLELPRGFLRVREQDLAAFIRLHRHRFTTSRV